MTTKDVIDQAGKEFSERYCAFEISERISINDMQNIKAFISSYTKDLLRSVVEMAEGMKKLDYKGCGDDLGDKIPYTKENFIYNQALSDIQSLLQKTQPQEKMFTSFDGIKSIYDKKQ